VNPYSSDLRHRAVGLYNVKQNFRAVAKHLKVSHTWVRDMVRLWQATGALDTQYQNCGRPPTITEREKHLLRQWLEEENGLTLRELQQRLAGQGVEVSHTAVDNTLKAMKITRKKNDRPRGEKPPRRPREARALAR